MAKLKNIKVGLECPYYQLNIEYSTPERIDLFSYILLDLIDHKKNFPEEKLIDVLLEMGIPHDLLNIFDSRFKELYEGRPKFINTLFGRTSLYVSMNSLSLTEDGRLALDSKELPVQIKEEQVLVVYDNYNDKFIVDSKVKKASESDSLIIKRTFIDYESFNDKIIKDVKSRVSYYIDGANSETKVYNIQILPMGDVAKLDTVSINSSNEGLYFDNDNPKVLEAIKNADLVTKRSLGDKFFKYFVYDDKSLKYQNAKILEDYPYLKAAFIDMSPNSEMHLDTYHRIEKNDYNVYGIDENNLPTMIRYSSYNLDGYMIPLTEVSHADILYGNMYDKHYSELFKNSIKGNIIDSNALMLLLSLTIKKNRIKVFKEILSNLNGNFGTILNELNKLHDKYINDKSYKEIIESYAYNFITNSIKKEKLTIDNYLSYAETYAFSKSDIFDAVLENYGKEEFIINKMLSLDEDEAIKRYGIKELYNNALLNNEPNFNFRCSMNSYFLNYYKQLDVMKKFGFNNYYNYSMVSNSWPEYIKEINILKDLYGKVVKYLNDENKKGADDFFVEILDIYYAQTPEIIDESSFTNGKDWEKNIQQAINKKNAFYIGLAAEVRYHFSNIFHKIVDKKNEKLKLKKNKDLNGKKLIQFCFSDKKKVNELYQSWRNLCIIVHSDTEKNDPLITGPEIERKKAILNALSVYKSYLKDYE